MALESSLDALQKDQRHHRSHAPRFEPAVRPLPQPGVAVRSDDEVRNAAGARLAAMWAAGPAAEANRRRDVCRRLIASRSARDSWREPFAPAMLFMWKPPSERLVGDPYRGPAWLRPPGSILESVPNGRDEP